MILIILSYIIYLCISIWGIRFYINLFRYPIYFWIPIILSTFIPLSIVILLPIDYVQHNLFKGLQWFLVPDNVILNLWRVKYWVTFLLTWLVLPLLQEFYKSGHYKTYKKLTDAIRKNLKFQLTLLGISIIGIIYLILEVGLTFNHLKSFVIGLSHIYALILALWLMAHGLINIPKNKWKFGSLTSNLNYHYFKVPKLIEDLEDCKIGFKEDIVKVLLLNKSFSNDDSLLYRDWIIDLYCKIPQDLKDIVELQLNQHDDIPKNHVNDNYLKAISSSFITHLNMLVAYEAEFNNIFHKIILLEDLNGSTINTMNFRLDQVSKPKFVWLYYIKPIVNRLFSICLFILSFIIIESEFFHSTKLSLVNVIFAKCNDSIRFIITSGLFLFMLICSLNSLTQLNIFNMYHLVAHKSDPVSTCFYATYIARLTIPLSYNFITLFISRDSVFENWFGKSIQLTGIFNLLNNWIPRLLFVPIVLTTFNLYDKLKRSLGFTNDLYESFGFNDTDNLDNNSHKNLIIVEAKRIIDREINRRLNNHARHFNIRSAANRNYEANRAEFQNQLINSNNRIEFNDELANPSTNVSSLWINISNQFNNLRNQFRSYRDEPLDDFNYDAETADHIV